MSSIPNFLPPANMSRPVEQNPNSNFNFPNCCTYVSTSTDHHHHHHHHNMYAVDDVDGQNLMPPEFDFSAYLAFLDQMEEEGCCSSSSNFTTPSSSLSQSPPLSQEMITGGGTAGYVESSLIINPITPENGSGKMKAKGDVRVAFRMKTELEIVDDGYKWRKYGKKRVKTSPHPRNYYKCAKERCSVKKRVERDGEDSSYVVTTYDGIHNHEIPSYSYGLPQL